MRVLNRMNTLLRVAGLGLIVLLVSAVVADAQVNRSLRILYAGRPGSDREKDFVAFLREHFDTVQTGDLQTFKEADTQGFDVTLLDWDANEFKGPRPQVSESFSRPMVTLGVPGGLISSQWRLKTGYL